MIYIRGLFNFITDSFANRKLILKLVNNDLKSRYSGSIIGIGWAFIQPLVTILVFWFVFQLGFKNPPVSNVEFILWFIAAYIPWIYFNDAILATSNCLYEYSYLVKKIKFRTSLLPIVKVIASTYVHIFFMIFVIIMYLLYGYDFSLAWLNIIYYSFCLFILIIGLSWIVSSISVFFKDFTQIVNIILQIGFWLVPVFWSPDTMSESIMKILKLNPLYYIIMGYRSCLIDKISFWQRGPITFYFWGVAIIIFIIGAITFKKLRVHFADIL